MKKIFLYQLVLLFIVIVPYSVKSQTEEVTFPLINYDFSLMTRTQLSSMSIKLFDDYYTHRPCGEAPGSNNKGILLSIYGRVNHWETNLYFGSDRKFHYRTSTWSGGTAEDGTVGGFHEWRTVSDSRSNVESSGILQISGDGDHYISQGRLVIGLNHFSLGTR